MTRRDRTTGLPAPQPRGRASSQATGAAGFISNRLGQFAVIGTAVIALLVVVGFFAYEWYDENIAQPGKVILSVDEEDFTLSYYADRLVPFAQANQFTDLGIAAQSLMVKFEEEGLAVSAARERGIELTDDEITEAIAVTLGVPVGGQGSAFDIRYRQELRTLGISDSHYRQLSAAAEADRRLREELLVEIGETGEVLLLRVIATNTAEQALAVRARIESGEDMGSIAQTESIHLQSRHQDGLLITPPSLLSGELQEVLVGVAITELAGPVQVDNGFWVLRLERTDPEGTYTPEQLDQLLALRFGEVLAETRTQVTVDRDFTSGDVDWAVAHADTGAAAGAAAAGGHTP